MDWYANKTSYLIKEASKWLGVKERGVNAGPEVEMFQMVIGKADGLPWCASFVHFCLRETDRAEKGHPHWIYPSEHVLTIWNKTPVEARIDKNAFELADAGMLVVWEHFNLKNQRTGSGHIGILIGKTADSLVTIEGNTGSGVAVEREGDGVYQRLRKIQNSGSMRVKGFLRCWDSTKP